MTSLLSHIKVSDLLQAKKRVNTNCKRHIVLFILLNITYDFNTGVTSQSNVLFLMPAACELTELGAAFLRISCIKQQ